MLERLEVTGLGIIDEVRLDLAAGFSVLTGETGAGKSLLVESLKLLSGQRSQPDLVRSGDDRLRVEGWFVLPAGSPLATRLAELEIPWEETLVLRREVAAGGRSRCWVNDVAVGAGTLQVMAGDLMAIHGQHEQHGLAEPRNQRRLVDEYGGHQALLSAVAEAHASWREAAAELDRLQRAQAGRRDRLDALAFQIAEIDGVAPHPGEDRELDARRLVLRHAVRIGELSRSVLDRLSERESAVGDELARAEREVRQLVECGLPLEAVAERLAEAAVHVQETVREVEDATSAVQEDPAELEEAESRLHRLEQLMLKYGSPLEAVLAHRGRLGAERRELEGVEDRLDQARSACGQSLADYSTAAEALQRARVKSGRRLTREVERVLARLNMSGTRLELRWWTRADESSPLVREGQAIAFDAEGVEEGELLIAANPGEEPRPLARIASGGELSRVHLALRSVLRARRGGSGLTLLFDEVDAGLGGATAAALSRLLADLAAQDQVVVVTHLPQVAARAAAHYRVAKSLEEGRAVTRVERLDGEGRELEIARMLAGDEVGGSARAHARALLESG